MKTTSELVALMAEPGYAAPINIGISPDAKDPTQYTVDAGQARLGLRIARLLSAARRQVRRVSARRIATYIMQVRGWPA